MTVVMLLLVLVVIGFALYLVERFIPLAAPIQLIIRVVVVILVILWLLQVFHVVGPRFV